MGLKRLVKHYGGDRVSAACQRALSINGVSYTSVHSMLKNGLDRVPIVVDAPAKVVHIQHANLRGPAYYQQALALLEA
jgi:hypothetical protein